MTQEEIKRYVIVSGSDSKDVFGGEYSGGIRIQQNPDEIAEILHYLLNLKNSYESMLEVGSAAGGNAKVFCEILKIKDLLVVDDNGHDNHIFRKDNLRNINHQEFIGNSQSKEASDWVASFNRTFDIIFIDADHQYTSVKNDVKNYIRFLKPDGIMIFHDYYGFEGVRKMVDEINLYGLEKIKVSSFIKCGIAVCKKIA